MSLDDLFAATIYATPMLAILAYYLLGKKKKHVGSENIMTENIKAGLTEPASIHPVININRCKGCGSCVTACPERKKNVLGLIDGKAELINPTYCIGHGACLRACPFDAITLVFGTEKRGVEIPNVAPNFETNVPGIYIAGELGGMGLIRNAITQGVKAMEFINKRNDPSTNDMLDILIVGAGPAGFAASLSALENKKKFKTIEQDSLGGTVYNFPRGKLVMTAPVDLPVVGQMKFNETTKEILMEFWQKVEKESGIEINYLEKVDAVTQLATGFEVKTSKATYKTRGTTQSCIPINRPCAIHRPALEAAITIADEQGTTVTLSYRSEAFARAKEKNRQKVDQAQADGKLNVLMKSNVKEIGKDTVSIDHDGKMLEIKNEGIIVSAGGILPTPFLKEIGIEALTQRQTVPLCAKINFSQLLYC